MGTDRFVWVRKIGNRNGVFVIHDLQEYYSEAFEMRRFRLAVVSDKSGIVSFSKELLRDTVLSDCCDYNR